MTTPSSGSIRRRRLGIELRQLRTAAGLTLEEVAKRFSWSVSKASRMERGLIPVSPRDIRDLAQHYGVTDADQVEGLAAMATRTRQRDWWHIYDDLLPRQFSVYLGFESDAASIHTCQTLLVPGLLQTADYARVLFRTSRPADTDEMVERGIDARMRRQAVLDRDDAPRLSVVLDEAVLRRRVGGSAIMGAQLEHLLVVSQRPNVTLQVVPYDAGAYMSMEGGFIILRFAESDGPDVVGVDTLTRSLYIDDLSEVRRYTMAYEHLLSHAATPADSRALIAAAKKEISP